jgi:hypothetical protein
LFLLVGLAVTGLFTISGHWAVPWVALGVGVLGVAAHWYVERRNLNRDLERNKAAAEAGIARGHLRLSAAGREATAGTDPAGPTWSAAHGALFALLVVAVLALPSSQYLRLVNRWPLNQDLSPHVVGPGDTVRVYFPNKLQSIKGYWNGTGQATLLNATELGVSDRLTVVSKKDTWGSQLNVKTTEERDSFTVWGDVTLPEVPALADKTLKLEVVTHVNYPAIMGDKFEAKQTELSLKTEVKTAATPRAGQIYQLAYYGGVLGGSVVILVVALSIMLLTKSHRAKALPTTIVPAEDRDAGAERD